MPTDLLYIPTAPDGTPLVQLADAGYAGAAQQAVAAALAQNDLALRTWNRMRRVGYTIQVWRRVTDQAEVAVPHRAAGPVPADPIASSLPAGMGGPPASLIRRIEAVLDARLTEEYDDTGVHMRVHLNPDSPLAIQLDPGWASARDDKHDSIIIWDAALGTLQYVLHELDDSGPDAVGTIIERDQYVIYKYAGRGSLYLTPPGKMYLIDPATWLALTSEPTHVHQSTE